MERLQKVIAQSGYTSRRKAEELIKEGKVSVNGEVVTELGTKVSGSFFSIIFSSFSLTLTFTSGAIEYFLNFFAKSLSIIVPLSSVGRLSTFKSLLFI